jgi:hypothetical protein
MAFLGSKASHLTCSHLIQKYLERDGRALAHDFVNLTEDEHARWAAVMDRTRRWARNDTGWGESKAVTYQHFVLSPDPADNVSLEDLRELTMAWVHEFFGDDSAGTERAGRLGSFQVAVVYHDDNEGSIPHAHVIVNNTDLETGRRLHTNRDESAALSSVLQQMCEARGLSFFAAKGDRPVRSKEGVFFTRTERELRRAGHYSWKDELRGLIESARRFSTDTEGFVKRLAILGVSVKAHGDDWVFASAKNPVRRCSGYRLGRNYTRSYTAGDIEKSLARKTERDTVLAQNVMAALRSLLDAADRGEHLEVSKETEASGVRVHAVCTDSGLSVRDIADTLALGDEFNITYLADYAREGMRIKRLLDKGLSSGMAASLQRDFERLRRARDVALATELYKGLSGSDSEHDARKREQARLAHINRQLSEGTDDSGSGQRRQAGQRKGQGTRKAGAAQRQRK